jgi:DNA-binding transcriptional LysR family regulator
MSRARTSGRADTTCSRSRWSRCCPRACIAAGFEPRIAYLTADPLGSRGLVAAWLAVTLTSKLLAPDLNGVATASLDRPPHRTVYAVVPSVGTHSSVDSFLVAIRSEARELGLRLG